MINDNGSNSNWLHYPSPPGHLNTCSVSLTIKGLRYSVTFSCDTEELEWVHVWRQTSSLVMHCIPHNVWEITLKRFSHIYKTNVDYLLRLLQNVTAVPLCPVFFFTWHLNTSSVLIFLACWRFSPPAAWMLIGASVSVRWGGGPHVSPANTWLCSLTLSVWRKWASSALMWWIIHYLNSCSCWNDPLAVKRELGLYWPSFYTTDKHESMAHAHIQIQT